MSNPKPNPLPNNLPNLPPPRLPQQLTLAARTKVVRVAVVTRCGGLDTISRVDVVWTGGNSYDGSVVAPTANGCYRSIDPGKDRKVEDKCV